MVTATSEVDTRPVAESKVSGAMYTLVIVPVSMASAVPSLVVTMR